MTTVAIVGGGVVGLAATYDLQDTDDEDDGRTINIED